MTASSYIIRNADDARRAIRTERVKLLAWRALPLALRTFGVALLLLQLSVMAGLAEGTMDRMVGLAISLGACGTFNGVLPLIDTARSEAEIHRKVIDRLQAVQVFRGWYR